MNRPIPAALRKMLDAARAAREYARPIGPIVYRNIALNDVSVRSVTEEAIAPLEAFLRSGDFLKHRDRLNAQRKGAGEYLVAWRLVPVGHLFIVWAGGSDGPLAQRRDREPIIEDVYVHPAARRRGIGNLLMNKAEALIRQRGFGSVGLTVGVDNPAVEAMYERRGYRDMKLGVFESRRTLRDARGREKTWSARVSYLVKVLENGKHEHTS